MTPTRGSEAPDRADERDFAAELRERKQEVERARDRLAAERGRQPALPVDGMTGADAWGILDATQRNRLLQSLLAAVIVGKAGRGKRVPLEDRVRVLRYGADVDLLDTRHGDRAAGVRPLTLPDRNHPDVLGMNDAGRGAGRVSVRLFGHDA